MRRDIQLLLAVATLFGSAAAQAKDVFLAAQPFVKVFPDGASILMWGFAEANSDFSVVGSPTSPGPLIRVDPGDSVLTITVRNDLSVPVSLVIPGLQTSTAPVRAPDGRVVSFVNEAAPGDTTTYSWVARPGTFLYQSGSHPAVQVQMGLIGGVVGSYSATQAYAPSATVNSSIDNEAVLVYSEVDPLLHQAIADEDYGPGLGLTSTIDYRARYFLINGEPFPLAQPILAQPLFAGQTLLVRFLNAGLQSHVPMFKDLSMRLVAEDGFLYPYSRDHLAAYLPAGKTLDAIVTGVPQGSFAVFDRRFFLTTGPLADGGMLAKFSAAAPVPVKRSPTMTKRGYRGLAPANKRVFQPKAVRIVPSTKPVLRPDR